MASIAGKVRVTELDLFQEMLSILNDMLKDTRILESTRFEYFTRFEKLKGTKDAHKNGESH